MVQLLSTLLSLEGYEVQILGRDEDVAAAVEGARPDALLLDMHLAGQNGLEVLDRLRRSEAAARVRIIMVSGLNVREDCLSRGADDFLLKPFMPADLLDMLHNTLRRPR